MHSRKFDIVVEAVYPGMSSIVISVDGRRHLMPSALLPADPEWFKEMTGRTLTISISAEELCVGATEVAEEGGSSPSRESVGSAT